MKDWMPIILAVIALVGGGGGLWSALTVGATRRKIITDAEAVNATTTTVLGKSAVELLIPLRERIRELEGEVEGLRRRVRDLNDQLDEKDAVILDMRRDRRSRREQPGGG